jgi:hypothetical protein
MAAEFAAVMSAKPKKAHSFERVANDWYVEPPEAVDALLDVERFAGLTLDPACGGGNIPERFAARGLHVSGSDLVNRGFGEGGVDFLKCQFGASTYNNVCSNPPFALADQFIRKALSVARIKVAMLLRFNFFESERRRELFATTPLARVWVCEWRLSILPGAAKYSAGAGGRETYAWFVWSLDHRGPPTLHRLRRPPAARPT